MKYRMAVNQLHFLVRPPCSHFSSSSTWLHFHSYLQVSSISCFIQLPAFEWFCTFWKKHIFMNSQWLHHFPMNKFTAHDIFQTFFQNNFPNEIYITDSHSIPVFIFRNKTQKYGQRFFTGAIWPIESRLNFFLP